MNIGVSAGWLVAALVACAPLSTSVVQAQAAAEFKWQELGARVFGQSCGVCHQPTGLGVPGAFPPLAGHVAESFAQPNGRAYLVRVVLYGLSGSITVKGNTFTSVMPP